MIAAFLYVKAKQKNQKKQPQMFRCKNGKAYLVN